ncbi:DUF1850 domain-containing protein [Chthonobacter albigriseus]|uniref:DUF1850 domain-containing protein n=1 Tax=Chthonobacter albigriseus TaxID=1683161 RepID=UPI0015EF8AF8|nr:DUF1850 domain-containing protein [Chthonobacter albigriseus]
MTALCIIAGGVVGRIAAASFTLGWIHSIEKTPIEDAWVIEGNDLRVVESRIKGSGAGIEPGDNAWIEGGWIVWTPRSGTRTEIVLRRSGAPGTGDWTIYTNGRCVPLGSLVPDDADPVVLRACR